MYWYVVKQFVWPIWLLLVIFMLYIPDYVVVGSDSGRIVILEYIAQKNIFEKVCF